MHQEAAAVPSRKARAACAQRYQVAKDFKVKRGICFCLVFAKGVSNLIKRYFTLGLMTFRAKQAPASSVASAGASRPLGCEDERCVVWVLLGESYER